MGLQEVKKLQGVKKNYKGLQGITGDYKALQLCYKGLQRLQRVTGA